MRWVPSHVTDSDDRPKRATMGGVTTAHPELCVVIGDEELLTARAVAEVTASVRAADPDADVREFTADALVPGELAEILSPSLFGGRRVLVVRNGQDAKKDLVAALLGYARDPDPDASLVAVHAGGGEGKAVAGGAPGAGAGGVMAGGRPPPPGRGGLR